MKQYLKETRMINYSHPEIQKLINERGWRNMDEKEKIRSIYDFVRNEIRFGYNEDDSIPATQVLSDGVGQCNTKSTLLIALLRAVGIPVRHHAFFLDHEVQKGVVPSLMFPVTPKLILHTWAEVWYQGKWMILEGVIIDDDFLRGFQNLYAQGKIKVKETVQGNSCIYQGYGLGVKTNIKDIDLNWCGADTFCQSEGIVQDLGVFESPDDCYKKYSQKFGKVKACVYKNISRKQMTKRTDKIRMYK